MNPNGNKLTNYRVGKQIIDMNNQKNCNDRLCNIDTQRPGKESFHGSWIMGNDLGLIRHYPAIQSSQCNLFMEHSML